MDGGDGGMVFLKWWKIVGEFRWNRGFRFLGFVETVAGMVIGCKREQGGSEDGDGSRVLGMGYVGLKTEKKNHRSGRERANKREKVKEGGLINRFSE